MKIHQLSLFVENKPNQLVRPCSILAQAGLNLFALNLADTQNFGILRLIVDDWQRAQTTLTAAGFVVNVTEVVALEVDDRPGSLAELLSQIGGANLNIEYMYAFAYGRAGRATMIFRFDNVDVAIERLVQAKLSPLARLELAPSGETAL